MHHYRNRWMPQAALDVLAAESGSILDVGGGASPYHRAAHVLDIIPFDAARLKANAWGGEPRGWSEADYSCIDICNGQRWPFSDQQFSLGLCSHTLEDLRDPLPALAEMGRVCQRLLLIFPSRMVEHTRGLEHPNYCGFPHHPWMVFQDGSDLVFQRKMVFLDFPGCHYRCPLGMTVPVDLGTFVYHGPAIAGRERMHWSGEEIVSDYRKFVAEHPITLEPDNRPMTWRRRLYRWRQRWCGVP